MHRRLASGAALATAAAMVLVGCAPPEPTATTPAVTASPTSSPEQYLSAARSAWDAYQARLAEIGAEPSTATIDALLAVAEPEHAEFLMENFQEAADARVHTEGQRSTMTFELASTTDAPRSLTASVCIDLTNDRLVGDEGEDLTPTDRQLLRGYLVTFSQVGDGLSYLVADTQEFDGPEGSNPCR